MRRFLALTLAAVAALATACGSDEPAADDPAPFTVMLNWTPNAHHIGLYVAVQRGWYEEAGLDVAVVEPGSDGVAAALAAGRADVGITVAESLLPARAAGVPVVSVAAILPHNDSSLIALADRGITRPRDLEHRRYGGFGGALETELISRLVACDGGDPSTVEFVEVGDVDYLTGMEQGAFDVAWVFSGWDALRATVVEGRELTELRFADHLDCIPDWYTPLYAASEETIDGDADRLRAFLEVSARGYEAASEDPAAATGDFMAAVPEADEQLVAAAVEYYATRFTDGAPWGTQDRAVWSEFATFLTAAGLLEEEVDVDAAHTNELLG